MFALYHAKTKQTETFEPVEGKGVIVGSCREDGPLDTEVARNMWRSLVASGWRRVDETPFTDTIRTSFSTDYFLVGTQAAIDDFREKLYANYHPCGYGTHVAVKNEIAPGVFTAKGFHSNSCD